MPEPVRIEMSGQAATVVQAGAIEGGVHVHARHAAPSPARPITEWHPFDLDVHRAVTVGTTHLPDLPAYVSREHDRALADLLSPRQTVLAVLTGESSTGKTRALYEAVVDELPTWPLLYPRTADDLLHVLATGVEPGTVLWLNETQNHLLGTQGEQAAAALRTLLELPGPFVVLGTLWPQYWSALTGPDQPQARNLLQHRVTRIRVAKRFTAAQMATAPPDPRLRKALATAHDGEVVQAIAGGPAVVERYDHPDTPQDRYATAILTAALDARRLGHHALLPTALLAAAAPGYLSEDDRVDAPETWFETGLQTATNTHLGVAALIPKRRSPGVGPPDGYHLHDYLDQHGRSTRRRALTPDTLWDALLAHAEDPEDQFRLSRSAYHRLRYRHADPLYRRAAATGSTIAALRLMDVLIAHGRVTEVSELLDRDPARIHAREVVEVLQRPWLPQRRVFLELFERRGTWASLLLADHLADTGATEDALAVLRRLPDSWRVRERLADLLADTGHWEEALEVVRDERTTWSGPWLAGRLAAAGNLRQLRRLAATGETAAVQLLAVLAGDHAEAVAAEAGRLLPALDTTVKALVSSGRRAEAIRFLRYVLPDTDERRASGRQVLLADLLAEEGHWQEVLDLAKGKPWAQEWIPKRLAHAGNIAALRRLADAGLDTAGRELAAVLAARGRYDELLDQTRKGDEHCAQQLVALAHTGQLPNGERLLAEGL
ncbi:hypothetical protein AB0H12_31740 [Actinosynnema sp. NPDC023794]